MASKKTHKATAKRFRVTARGKVMFSKAGRGHLLSQKPQKRKLDLRRKGKLSKTYAKQIKSLLAS